MNKIEFIAITENELPEYIFLCYNGDYDFLTNYHYKKMGVVEAVEYELSLIKEAVFEFTFYKVLYAGIKIGYVVAFGDFIFSFSVAKKYRKKEILEQWWEMMLYFFREGIKFGMLSNNIRAINFFKKRGMKITWESEDVKEKRELLLTF